MTGHAEQCVDKYLELANLSIKSLKQVATPCMDDHQLAPEDFDNKGALEPVCARIVLKVLFLARMSRPDLLWSVNVLARDVTRWNVACDKRLHRLISYLHSTKEWIQLCIVGDKAEDCKLALFTDASFAGDLRDSKSTTGAYLFLVGPNTFVPITWFCKKQGAVSHSSSEAEVIALDAGIRMEGIPALMLWEEVINVFSDKKVEKEAKNVGGNPYEKDDSLKVLNNVDWVPPSVAPLLGRAQLIILEDNDAVIKMTIKGRSPALRHVPRTHRIDLDWLFERIRDDPGVAIRYVNTKFQIADILTKGSFTSWQWTALCELSQILPPLNQKLGVTQAKEPSQKPKQKQNKVCATLLGATPDNSTQEKPRKQKRWKWFKRNQKSNTPRASGQANFAFSVSCCEPHIFQLPRNNKQNNKTNRLSLQQLPGSQVYKLWLWGIPRAILAYLGKACFGIVFC